MSKKLEEIRAKMKAAFKGNIQTFAATVLAVDEPNMTIDVEPIGQVPINEVRLKAAIDQVTDGIVEFPKVDSSVLIGLIGNNDNEAVLIKSSQVDKVVMFGGANGGLINIQTLIEELNKTNDVVDAIKDTLTTWPITPNDGGKALQEDFKIAIEGKKVGDFTKMEDIKITH